MPSRTATVIRPDIAPGRRVLAISDIHGNLPFLKGVLAKAGYAAGKDVLVLVGDLLEKGQESLATLRYIMELSAMVRCTPYVAIVTILTGCFWRAARGGRGAAAGV